MNRGRLLLPLLLLVMSPTSAQQLRTYVLTGQGLDSPPSNSINELILSGDTLWTGTSRGPSFALGTFGGWTHLSGTAPLKVGGISGIAVDGSTVWLAYATTTKQDDEFLPTGDDLYVSHDRGVSWTLIPQPVDSGTVDTLDYGANKIPALMITTKVNNLTYDIAASGGYTWIANFAGMLRMSADSGATWSPVILPPDTRDSIRPSDSLDFDLAPTSGRLGLVGNLNHRVFAVTVAFDGSVWVGTAGGVNRSTDNGSSWRKFSHSNQARPISGNFVVALREQRWSGRSRMWAATVNAEGSDEQRGVSYTDDNGETWNTALIGEFAHNFAFGDSVVYVPTDRGLFRSTDLGGTWSVTGSITDEVSHQRFVATDMITAAASGDTVWVGGPEGVAWTLDGAGNVFGQSWTILRTMPKVGISGDTYSYPLPFSPDDEPVRIHYSIPSGAPGSVSIRIFDFSMIPVRTVLHDALRTPGREYDEIWDGRNEVGEKVANGAYFYRVIVDGADPLWGKILVVE